MWCLQCQQDVPVLASSDEGKRSCPRCGLDLGIVPTKRKTAPASASEERSPAAPSVTENGDGWELDEQLRHIEKVLKINKRRSRSSTPHVPKQNRIDPPHPLLAERHRHEQRRSQITKRRVKTSTPQLPSSSSVLTWTAFFLGALAFLGGGISLGYSLQSGKTDFWNLGLPWVVGGQLMLLIAFVMQLERVRRDHRSATAKLNEVGDELRHLKTATTLLNSAHASPASSFYAHFVGGANAQLLLADLKSQLDLLAVKMADREES